MLHIPGLYIAHTDKRGRGVFTAEIIEAKDIIEVCPLIMIPKDQLATIHQTVLHDYYFLWPTDEGKACMALGYGSIYNHDFEPNAEVIFDLNTTEIVIQSLKTIDVGDEITIDYTGGIRESTRLWFEVK